MAKKEHKATIIRVSEVSLENMTQSAKSNSVATRKVKKSGATCWAQTALWLNSVSPLEKHDVGTVEEIAESLRAAFKKAFLEEADIPEEGKNARNGETMDIIDPKTGEPKWSSWEETRNPISYCGEFAQIIKAGLIDTFIVSEKSCMAKGDIMAMAKVGETPLATIERCLKLIDDKFGALKLEEAKVVIELMNVSVAGMNAVVSELDK